MFLMGAFTLATLTASAICYPTGPPDSACYSMEPSHLPFHANKDDGTYVIKVAKRGSNYTVRIEAGTARFPAIRGVFIQARRVGSSNPLGRWNIQKASEQHLRVRTCPHGKDNAVAHTSSFPRVYVEAVWDSRGEKNLDEVNIRATVAEHYYTFWTGLSSSLPK